MIRPQNIHPEPTQTGKIRRPRQPMAFSAIMFGSDRAVPGVTSNLKRHSALVPQLSTSQSDSIGQNGQNGQNGRNGRNGQNGQNGPNCPNCLLFHELRKIPSGKIGDFIRPSMSRDARAHVSCDEIMRRFSTQNESIK